MAHYRGVVQGGRGESSRCGTKKSGLVAVASSWRVAVTVDLFQENETGRVIVRAYPYGQGLNNGLVLFAGTEEELLAKIHRGKEKG